MLLLLLRLLLLLLMFVLRLLLLLLELTSLRSSITKAAAIKKLGKVKVALVGEEQVGTASTDSLLVAALTAACHAHSTPSVQTDTWHLFSLSQVGKSQLLDLMLRDPKAPNPLEAHQELLSKDGESRSPACPRASVHCHVSYAPHSSSAFSSLICVFCRHPHCLRLRPYHQPGAIYIHIY